MRSALKLAFLVLLAVPATAGGPLQIAGASYFDSAAKGQPLTWTNGSVTYYTDQGNLSPVLDQAAANALVADAFSHWTSISTVALTATRAGQLAEDVNGSNVILSGNTLSLPPDIQPNATNKPVAIVYDTDGQVTDAFLGSGASFDCVGNAVFGGPDGFSTDAHFSHALVVLNGLCSQNSNQLADFEYRLVRILGRILGLGWSQVNINVWSGIPLAKNPDRLGFPVMHAQEINGCLPISICLPTPEQPRMDDRASLARLYPVTAQNLSSFPGKQIFSANTARISGSVSFAAVPGQAGQPMQGVNVVARWMDPSSGQPSRTYAAASISGFLFRGNAGNAITGTDDPTGQPYDRFGSDDPTVEGAFDLAGLEFPTGGNTAQYQLSVEAVDPQWSTLVGPYGPWQVQPSGAATPVVITVMKGNEVAHDIVMTNSAPPAQDHTEPNSFDAPAPVPPGGDFTATLSGYADEDYYQFSGQANRTLSVEVTAANEAGNLTQDKAQPVIGMWSMAAPSGTPPPASTPTSFNTSNFGMTRLDAQLFSATDFRIGVADLRGDGRPDYSYRMRVFYGDTLSPVRAGVNGGDVLVIKGLGFRPNMALQVAGQSPGFMSLNPGQALFSSPASTDGVVDIDLSDPATGASSRMIGALTIGAGPNDTLHLLSSGNPAIPVGGESVNPILLQVLEADGVTPVNGATVRIDSTAGGGFSACNGVSGCSLITDESGKVSTRVQVQSPSVITVTAALAPASYSNPSTVQTTVVGAQSSLDITLVSQNAWIAHGATLDVPLVARVLNNGSPLLNRTVNYTIQSGTATLSAASAVTNVSGYASATARLSQLSSDVQISACVAPNNAPCKTFSLKEVPLSAMRLEWVSGTGQLILLGRSFQPVVARVVESSTFLNPVQGADVDVTLLLARASNSTRVDNAGDTVGTRHGSPVFVGSSQQVLHSDAAGLVSVLPAAGVQSSPIEVQGTLAIGVSELSFQVSVLEGTSTQPGQAPAAATATGSVRTQQRVRSEPERPAHVRGGRPRPPKPR
jgi:hypothetical protein